MGKMKRKLAEIQKQVEALKVPKQHNTIQYSDQTRCRNCGKVWDTNDDEPPCE